MNAWRVVGTHCLILVIVVEVEKQQIVLGKQRRFFWQPSRRAMQWEANVPTIKTTITCKRDN
eukprot:FN604254.1.p3 GENE.FN604254.1~~FN604254.1.p3  ORF type:complete len:62 (+),score=5.72 FN604254.1:82-267(+)